MSRIRLSVLGISGSQSNEGAYVLMLGEQDGDRRLPVVIGMPEAQSIALCLEHQKAPRPLMHDLFFNLCNNFNIEALEVFIYKFQDGLFFTNILCFNGSRKITIDSRTSDAVAIALRFCCPIFVTEEIMKYAGVSFTPPTNVNYEPVKLTDMSLEELYIMLAEMVKNEDYEMASTVRDEIKRRG